MYIPDVKFLAEFRGELCEKQTKKDKKKRNHIFGTVKGWNGTEKSRPQNAYQPSFKFLAQFGG